MTRITDLDFNRPIQFSGEKVCTVEELDVLAQAARAAGKTIVHAHGVFDLLHLGHVRHLEAAHKLGDVLFVTITADQHVNKGPGRPIFSEMLRAEMLASLSLVDRVAVSRAPTAEGILRAVRPDVYVKGSDYENAEDDVTGKIDAERQIVESYGGRVEFTKGITFSSSGLINRYLDIYDPPLQELLVEMRNSNGGARLLALLDTVAKYKVVLVGETIIDDYQYVAPVGKSSKENIISTRFLTEENFAGGVIAAANHVAGFCREVEVITVLGERDRERDEALIRSVLLPNVRLHVVSRRDAPTVRKRRFVEEGTIHKLFEVQYLDDTPLPTLEADALNGLVERLVPDADVTIAADFGHGMIGPETVRILCTSARFLAVNTQSNSANMGFNLVSKYPRADYLCVDAPEARLATGHKFAPVSEIVCRHLPERIRCPRIVITHGKNGCHAFDAVDGESHIPVLTKVVRDTMGAGDAFLAVTSPLAAAGGRMKDIGFIGNAVGAIKVGIVGHRQPVEKVPLVKFITALLK